MFQFVNQFLVVVQFEFSDFVHESLNVSHSKQLTDKRPSLELLEIVNVLSSTYVCDRTLGCSHSEVCVCVCVCVYVSERERDRKGERKIERIVNPNFGLSRTHSSSIIHVQNVYVCW